MADVTIRRISIRNWMRILDASTAFPEKGLVLVTGNNLSSGGKLASVGAGKTSLGEAISRALTGIPGRFTSLKSFSTLREGDTYVCLECNLRGQELIIEIGYKCPELSKTGEALRFTYNGATTERSRIQETREELSRLINLAPEIAPWTIFLDGRKLDFGALPQATAVELLMSATAQPPWNTYHERSRTVLSNFKQNMTAESATHARAIQQVNESQADIAQAAEALKTAEAGYQKELNKIVSERTRLTTGVTKLNQSVTQAQTRLVEISDAIKTLTDTCAEEQHQLEIRLNAARDEKDVLHENVAGTTSDQTRYHLVYNSDNRALTELLEVPKNCPTCGQPWTQTISESTIRQQQNIVDKSKAAYEQAMEARSTVQKWLSEKQQEVNRLDGKLAALRADDRTHELSQEAEDLETKITQAQREAHKHELSLAALKNGADHSAVKEAQATLAERTRILQTAKTSLQESAETLAMSQEALKIIEYWHKAYGPAGIPNMILQDLLAPLNSVSRRISNLLTGNIIEVSYSTRRELATGDARPELNIKVENKCGAVELQGNSKGEGGLANFIIAETLAEIGNISKRIGYRWFDEVVPNQDPVVCQNIFAYLKEKAERLGILIFLVEHNPVAANYADHILTVEKTAADTRFIWDR